MERGTGGCWGEFKLDDFFFFTAVKIPFLSFLFTINRRGEICVRVYIEGFCIASDKISGQSRHTHTAQSSERQIDGVSLFYRFLVIKNENCLPTSLRTERRIVSPGEFERKERRWAAGEKERRVLALVLF